MLALYTLAASFLLPSRLQAPVPAAAHRTPQPRAAADECVVFSTLAQRRSVAKYDSSNPVPANVVTAALEAAILAPNHFLTEPWRFYQCGPETVAKLCALNEDKRAMFEGVPGWIVVTVATEYDDAGLISTKKGLEDHAAVSCAIQNMMLSFSDDGIGEPPPLITRLCIRLRLAHGSRPRACRQQVDDRRSRHRARGYPRRCGRRRGSRALHGRRVVRRGLASSI